MTDKATVMKAIETPGKGVDVSHLSEEEWLGIRKTRIGGSDWQHLLDIPPYGCKRQLFLDKSGEEPSNPFVESAAIRSGKRLEKVAVEVFMESLPDSCEVVGRNLMFDPPDDFPMWFGGNVDCTIQDQQNGSTFPLECKVRSTFTMRDVITATKPPDAVLLQELEYLPLVGNPWGAIIFYQPHPEAKAVFQVEADVDMLVLMLEAGEAFWQRVRKGSIPDQLPAGARACKNCTFREMCWQGAVPESDDRSMDLVKLDSPALCEMVNQYIVLRDQEKQISEAKKLARSVILEELGDVARANIDGHRVYATRSKRVSQAKLVKYLAVNDPDMLVLFAKTVNLDLAREKIPAIVEEMTALSGSPGLKVY